MANYLTIRIRLLIAILASVFPLSTMKAEEGKMYLSHRKAGTSVLRVECLSVSLLSQVSDMTRRTLVGLQAYMAAIVSTPYSRQSYPPSMER